MRRSLVLTFLALVLGGCATAPATDEEDELRLVVASFEQRDCDAQEIVASVPPDSLAPYLPDGFVAEPFPADGLSGVIAVSVRCEEPLSAYGLVVIPLIATPDGLSRENATAQGIVVTMILSPDDPMLPTLESWGFGETLAEGTTTLEDTTPPGLPTQAGTARSTISADANYEIVTNVRSEPRMDEGNLLRLFQVHDREVIATWDWDLTGNHTIHSGQAVMQATGLPPLPEGNSAGLGFREHADSFLWIRVA